MQLKTIRSNNKRPECVYWDAKAKQCVNTAKPFGEQPSIMACQRLCNLYEGPNRSVDECQSCGSAQPARTVPMTAREKLIAKRAGGT